MDWLTNVESIAVWMRSWGVIAVIGSILLNIVISITGVLPSIFLSGANAIVFGLFGGFVVSLIGEVVGAGIAFVLYRWGITRSKTLNKIEQFKWIRRLNEISRMKRIVTIILLRMNPLLPSGVVNVTASFTTMSFLDFMIATFIGKVPSMVFETFVGHDIVYMADNKVRLAIALLLGASVFLLFKYNTKEKSVS